MSEQTQPWIDRHHLGWVRIFDDEGFWTTVIGTVILLPLVVGIVLIAVEIIR